jgi:hypothetical protein
MADLTRELDGDFTLEETTNACLVEQDGGFQLQSIEFGTKHVGGKALPINKAEFMAKAIGRFKKLLFVELGANNPDTIRKQKEAEGWTAIGKTTKINIQAKQTAVLVFGRK